MLRDSQRNERSELVKQQKLVLSAKISSGKLRYSKGVKRVFDYISGRNKRVQLINKKEIHILQNRQSKIRQELVRDHLEQQAQTQQRIERVKNIQRSEREQLSKVIKLLNRSGQSMPENKTERVLQPRKKAPSLKNVFEKNASGQELSEKKLSVKNKHKNIDCKLNR